MENLIQDVLLRLSPTQMFVVLVLLLTAIIMLLTAVCVLCRRLPKMIEGKKVKLEIEG